jgi:hypothetical protein
MYILTVSGRLDFVSPSVEATLRRLGAVEVEFDWGPGRALCWATGVEVDRGGESPREGDRIPPGADVVAMQSNGRTAWRFWAIPIAL